MKKALCKILLTFSLIPTIFNSLTGFNFKNIFGLNNEAIVSEFEDTESRIVVSENGVVYTKMSINDEKYIVPYITENGKYVHYDRLSDVYTEIWDDGKYIDYRPYEMPGR